MKIYLLSLLIFSVFSLPLLAQEKKQNILEITDQEELKKRIAESLNFFKTEEGKRIIEENKKYSEKVSQHIKDEQRKFEEETFGEMR